MATFVYNLIVEAAFITSFLNKRNKNKITDTMEKLEELQKQAQEYYSKCGPASGVIARVEEILNNTFYRQPTDIYGFISTYFEQFCDPQGIAKIIVEVMPNCRGQMTVRADVYTLCKNEIKYSAGAVSSYTSDYELKLAAGFSQEELSRERLEEVEQARRLIEAFCSELMHGVRITEQCCIDTEIVKFFIQLQTQAEADAQAAAEALAAAAAAEQAATAAAIKEQNRKPEDREQSGKSNKSAGGKKKKKEEAEKASLKPAKSKSGAAGKSKQESSDVGMFFPSEPFESFYPGSVAVSAVSQAVCRAAAQASGLQTFQYIRQLLTNETKSQLCDAEFSMPVPMFTVFSGGRRLSGCKLKCFKDLLLIPSPCIDIREAMKTVNYVYSFCESELMKRNTLTVNGEGILSPVLEKIEDGLELISSALSQLNQTLGSDFYVALNCASHEIYVPTLEKYELSVGRYVTSSELVSYWSDLLRTRPYIIALIDPLRSTDSEAWNTLYEEVRSHCYILSDYAYGRPGKLYSDLYCHISPANVFCCDVKCVPNVDEEPDDKKPDDLNNSNDKLICDNSENLNPCDTFLGAGDIKCESPTGDKINTCTGISENNGDNISNNAAAAKDRDQKKNDKSKKGAADKNKAVETPDKTPAVEETAEKEVEDVHSVVCRLPSCGAMIRFEHADTLTDIISCTKILRSRCMDLSFGAGYENTPDDFLADLVMGLQGRFVWLGCVSKGQSCRVLARLMQIERDLRVCGLVREACSQFMFYRPEESPGEEGKDSTAPEAKPTSQDSSPKAKGKGKKAAAAE